MHRGIKGASSVKFLTWYVNLGCAQRERGNELIKLTVCSTLTALSSFRLWERIVECDDPGAWKKTIEDAEDRLVSWTHRHQRQFALRDISPNSTNTGINLWSLSIACSASLCISAACLGITACPQGGRPSVGGACVWSDQDHPRRTGLSVACCLRLCQFSL